MCAYLGGEVNQPDGARAAVHPCLSYRCQGDQSLPASGIFPCRALDDE
jgi:hypothetical protein